LNETKLHPVIDSEEDTVITLVLDYDGQRKKVLVSFSATWSQDQVMGRFLSALSLPLDSKIQLSKDKQDVTISAALPDQGLASNKNGQYDVEVLELGTQEVDGKINDLLESLADALSMKSYFARALDPTFGNSVLLKCDGEIEHKDLIVAEEEIRSVIRVALHWGALYLVHLDHKKEDTRLQQAQQLLEWIKEKGDKDKPHVLAGDFNSLTESDYSESYLGERNLERRKFRIEDVRFDVMKKLNQEGYVDVLQQQREIPLQDAEVATCEYKTRVDYILLSRECKVNWDQTGCVILQESLSDHKPLFLSLCFSE